MHRISPGHSVPGCVLRLDAVQIAPSVCLLANNADASGRSARTYDSGHYASLTVSGTARLSVCPTGDVATTLSWSSAIAASFASESMWTVACNVS
ncbi:MAG: hypothetical protein BMS9Abin12_1315 [Acidimicrobiia bacterium]|nr:MAG: hypothetical protein BMS9Abin12_1315 [Acidimicrobiia bacterium]